MSCEICECNRSIKKGDKYWYFEAYWSTINGWGNHKTCLKCENLRKLVEDKYPPVYAEEGPAFGQLFEYIREERR